MNSIQPHIRIVALLFCFWGINLTAWSQTPGGGALPTATPAPIQGPYPRTGINYIRTYEPTKPYTDAKTIITTNDVKSVRQSTLYIDGLGRDLQTVVKGISGQLGRDLVTPIIYDAYGRERFKYLPYVQQTGNTNDGKFKTDPFNAQKAFYQNTTLMPGISGENIYYSRVDYEPSLLNRVLKTYAPGNSWAKNDLATVERGGNHPIENQYMVNTAADSVRIWDIAAVIPTSAAVRMYPAGELYKNVSIDEIGSQTVEYKDKDGRIILRKVQLAASNPGTAHMGWLCTYYVYDDLGNLRFVLSPKAVAAITNNWVITPAIAAELCFIYRYDNRTRMMVKKIPGADSMEIVYDVRDRPVFARDGNLKLQNKWLATFYDGLNRPTMTALYDAATARVTLQTSMDGAVSNTQSIPYTFKGETDLVLGTYDGSTLYQASNSITFQDGFDSGTGQFTAEIAAVSRGADTIIVTNPLPGLPASALTPLTYIYYDNYNHSGKLNYEAGDIAKPLAGTNPYAEALPSAGSIMTRGLVTGTKVRVLGTDQWLITSTYYDDKGRIIQTVSDNNTGGKDISTNLYDFNGKLLSNYLRHKDPRSGTTPQTTVLTMMHYDQAGRLDTVKKRLNDKANLERTIAENTYDELGQLKRKRLNVTGLTTQLDSLNYAYNIHGWLNSINKTFLNSSSTTGTTNWFAEELSYDVGFTSNQYNGNIAGAKWKSRSDGIARAYGYSYDRANRLTIADFNQRNSSGAAWTRDTKDFSVSNLNYDANGNIGTMTQKGMLGTAPAIIDQLTYSYGVNSNKLMSVADPINTATARLGDFVNGSNSGDDYVYDTNGNLTRDMNKNITAITYNHLNLPQSITITSKGNITYQYDAAGNKLKKTVTDNTTTPAKVTVTDYVGPFVYQNDTLQFVSHEEGRIRTVFKIGQPIDYTYDYFEKDHLGNVRVVLTEQKDLSMYTATMETASAAKENALFSNVDNTRVTKPVGYPADESAGSNASVARLTAVSGGKKIGPSIVLRVMAGDSIQIGAKAFYKSGGPENKSAVSVPAESMLADLVQVFSGDASPAGAHGTASTDQLTPFTSNFYNNDYQRLKEKDPDDPNSNRPKAYLNFVLFDDQFNLVDENSGVKQVKAAPDQLQTLAQAKMAIKKSGFLYVYTSNESSEEIFFDNVILGVMSGPLLEETHYYPFGLAMEGISGKAAGSLENKKKWNAGSELQNKEFSDGSGLELYATNFRNLDPQLGRFWQIDPKPNYMESPYVAMGNNPIFYNDPLGDTLLTRADHKRAARIEKQINKANASLNKNVTKWTGQITAAQAKGNTSKVNSLQGKVNDANARIATNTNTLNNLNAISSDQTQAYTFNQLPAGSTEGGTMSKTMSVNGSNQSVVVMNVLSDANAVHELTHAYQGAIQHMFSFNLDNAANSVTFHGATIFAAQQVNTNSEVAAYQAQYGFSSGSMPSSTMGGTPSSMSNINAFYVGGLNGTNAAGTAIPIYPNVQNMINTIFSLLRVRF